MTARVRGFFARASVVLLARHIRSASRIADLRRLPTVVLGVGLMATTAIGVGRAAEGDVPREPLEREQYHLRRAQPLTEHFEGVLREDCPKFTSSAEWRAYMQTEVDRMILLAAHMEQAWVEAKRAPDDEVRRVAKAPRRRLPEAQTLIDKLSSCAQDNGASLSVASLYRRLERDVPRRQADIALPPAP
jgi:hypothetical protein